MYFNKIKSYYKFFLAEVLQFYRGITSKLPKAKVAIFHKYDAILGNEENLELDHFDAVEGTFPQYGFISKYNNDYIYSHGADSGGGYVRRIDVKASSDVVGSVDETRHVILAVHSSGRELDGRLDNPTDSYYRQYCTKLTPEIVQWIKQADTIY